MKPFIQLMIIWTFLLGIGLTPLWAETDIGALKKGVVKISAEFSHGEKVGTGFLAAQGKKHWYVVTASHVVEGETEAPNTIRVTFYTHQEEAYTAKVVKKEGGDPRGLALLKVAGDLPEDLQPLTWDTTTLVHGGEEVHFIGFPRVGGNAWAVTKGTVSGFDGPVLKFSGAVGEGNSGGPVLYQGRVIGVVMEVTGQFGNAKPAQIAKFTVENWPGYPRLAVTTDSSFESEPHHLGIGSPSGVPQTGMAMLVVQSTPGGAQVFVDDEFVGQTDQGPVVVPGLEPDDYDVLVTKEGFRSWDQTVTLRAGDRRTLNAALQEGKALVVTGVWRNPAEPTISYVLQQQGATVTMTEITTSLLGTMVTAQGEGQLQGQQLDMMYRTALGTMGQSTTTLSEDGQRLVGAFQDFSNMIPVAISLVRTGEAPPAFSPPGSANFNTLQNFGQ